MTTALEALTILDATHVLAGPFASHQLGVLGARVIKIEDPNDPDQARLQGSDRTLVEAGMGTAFQAQAANKDAVALDLKTEAGRRALHCLIAGADVFVENYRPGALAALGLGPDDLAALNPQLVTCSISAYGGSGPMAEETAYDNVIQGFSGMMAMTGFDDGQPLKAGAPVVDYATGTTAALAIVAALLHRERTGKAQHIDVSMLDVAMMLMSAPITGYLWNGAHPEAKGNTFPFATLGGYRAKDADMMIGASNLAQQRRLWTALGREDLVKHDNNSRIEAYEEESAALSAILATMPAAYWEEFFRVRRIPAKRVRRLEETLADPQIAARPVLHRFESDGDGPALTVPVAGYTMSRTPPRIETPPQRVGAQTEAVLREAGFDTAEIETLRSGGAFGRVAGQAAAE